MSGVMMKDNSLREKPRQNNTKQGRMKRWCKIDKVRISCLDTFHTSSSINQWFLWRAKQNDRFHPFHWEKNYCVFQSSNSGNFVRVAQNSRNVIS
jgi:hypothetical protein